VDARLTHRLVEIFYEHRRVASHVRRFQRYGHVTVNEHMPKSHQRYANVTPASQIRMAACIGVNAAILVERMMRERPYPEQGYRSAMGIIALARRYERERLEAACERALAINAISYSSVSVILKSGLDRKAPPPNRSKPHPRTPTSVAAPTINKGKESDADKSHPRPDAGPGPRRHGRRVPKLAEQDNRSGLAEGVKLQINCRSRQ
jgi:transposase